MHWSHTNRQGWLVIAAGMALLNGCGTPAATHKPHHPRKRRSGPLRPA